MLICVSTPDDLIYTVHLVHIIFKKYEFCCSCLENGDPWWTDGEGRFVPATFAIKGCQL